MGRYIDGDLLMEYWDTFTWVDRQGMNREFAYIPAGVVENALKFAVDVKPTIHAHWVETEDLSGDHYAECSNCRLHWWIDGESAKDAEMHYCPRCGAKMDEEG